MSALKRFTESNMSSNSNDEEPRGKILSALRACEMSAPAKIGFGLMMQTLKSSGLAESKAQQLAFEYLAKMVENGELEIVDNSLLVTKKGQQWLKQEIAEGRGREN
jgi:hypothetical protein